MTDPTPQDQERARAIVYEINICAGNSDFEDGVYDDEIAGLIATALAEQRERDAETVENTTLGTEHVVRIRGAKTMEEAISLACQQTGKMMVAAWAGAIRRGQ